MLNRKCLETPLPHMTARAMSAVITANMRGQQPLHPATQVPIAIGLQNKMDMVGHQAGSQNIQRQTNARLTDEPNERLIIQCIVKHNGARIATIHNVVTQSSD